jgi:hypothetical protein
MAGQTIRLHIEYLDRLSCECRSGGNYTLRRIVLCYGAKHSLRDGYPYRPTGLPALYFLHSMSTWVLVSLLFEAMMSRPPSRVSGVSSTPYPMRAQSSATSSSNCRARKLYISVGFEQSARIRVSNSALNCTTPGCRAPTGIMAYRLAMLKVHSFSEVVHSSKSPIVDHDITRRRGYQKQPQSRPPASGLRRWIKDSRAAV